MPGRNGLRPSRGPFSATWRLRARTGATDVQLDFVPRWYAADDVDDDNDLDDDSSWCFGIFPALAVAGVDAGGTFDVGDDEDDDEPASAFIQLDVFTTVDVFAVQNESGDEDEDDDVAAFGIFDAVIAVAPVIAVMPDDLPDDEDDDAPVTFALFDPFTTVDAFGYQDESLDEDDDDFVSSFGTPDAPAVAIPDVFTSLDNDADDDEDIPDSVYPVFSLNEFVAGAQAEHDEEDDIEEFQLYATPDLNDQVQGSFDEIGDDELEESNEVIGQIIDDVAAVNSILQSVFEFDDDDLEDEPLERAFAQVIDDVPAAVRPVELPGGGGGGGWHGRDRSYDVEYFDLQAKENEQREVLAIIQAFLTVREES